MRIINKILRILDANVNRAAEGIRVIEDVCRFYYEDIEKTEQLKNMRHLLRKTLASSDIDYIFSRDAEHDIGKEISGKSNIDNKTSLKQLLNANFKRAEEAVRCLEENLKIIGQYEESKVMEQIRYECYHIEKEVMKLLKQEIPEGLYCITAEEHSKGRTNIEVVREMIKGGAKIIQYREKDKSLKQIYNECVEIRKITKENNVMFIVNDHIDVCMLVDADGVHIGQDDLPISEVRKLVGDKIIGLSTHSPEQAEQAVKDGADYIGVGPIYKTFTKKNVCDPVGLEYLEYAVKNIKIPFVAIGGIKEHNLEEITKRGAKRVCLVTEITWSENIEEICRRIDGEIKEGKNI